MDTIIMWIGAGWYAPRQEGGAVWWYWCGGDRTEEPNTYPMGLGTPEWIYLKPLVSELVEVKAVAP